MSSKGEQTAEESAGGRTYPTVQLGEGRAGNGSLRLIGFHLRPEGHRNAVHKLLTSRLAAAIA
jgi:hypothetical protein